MNSRGPESIDELRVAAQAGLREDAAPAAAAAREALLQVYRERFRVSGRLSQLPGTEPDAAWGPEDVAALYWIDALALAGHIGAARLRDRIIDTENGARALVGRFPARVKAFGLKSFWPALVSAQQECRLPNPNREDICLILMQDWQRVGSSTPEERKGARVIASIFKLLEFGGALRPAAMPVLGRLLERTNIESFARRGAVGAVFFQVAMAYLGSHDEGERAAGDRLLAEAAALGSPGAWEERQRRNPGESLRRNSDAPPSVGPGDPVFDEVQAELESAGVFLDIGDCDGAHAILVMVLQRGTDAQRQRALALLTKC